MWMYEFGHRTERENMEKLIFPPLELIKSKDISEGQSYCWIIFDIPSIHTYCRITYNEDENKRIFLDIMQNGYCDRVILPGTCQSYKPTQKEYEELKENCESAYNRIVSELLNINKNCMEIWNTED